jgi:prepilin-type N-terminal cleavage/methylation domain-containing protein
VIAKHCHHKGYTLIEIMVVIAVIALIATIAIGSINQTMNRRYASEAEQLSVWLNQLADVAVMQGAAFGIVLDIDEKSKKVTDLSAAIYYRNQWSKVSFPNPVELSDDAVVEWLPENPDQESLFQQQQDLSQYSANYGDEKSSNKKNPIKPTLVFLPDGYVEPAGAYKLSYLGYEISYNYYWDAEEFFMKMEKKRK